MVHSIQQAREWFATRFIEVEEVQLSIIQFKQATLDEFALGTKLDSTDETLDETCKQATEQ